MSKDNKEDAWSGKSDDDDEAEGEGEEKKLD